MGKIDDIDDIVTEKIAETKAESNPLFFTQKLLATIDVDDAKAKSDVTQKVIRQVAMVRNPIEREGYIDPICKMLKVAKGTFKKLLKDEMTIDVMGHEEADEVASLKEEMKAKGITDDEAFDNLLNFGVYAFKGVYWSKGDKRGDIAITNFVMEILFHVNTGNDVAYRIVKLHNKYGFETVININTDDMTSVGTFRKILARQSGGFTFKGNDNDLIRLSEWLQKTEKPTRFVGILGYQSKHEFYAFANGVVDCSQLDTDKYWHQVDDYGIVKVNDADYFIPAMSKVYADKEDLFTNDKKFIYLKKLIEFKEWAAQYQLVYGDKAMASILFAVACINRDVIFKKLKRMVMFFYYGQRGSGKGTMIHSLMYLWGTPQDQLMLGGGSTIKATMRKFAQFRNAMIWLDEYKNNIGQKPIESLKNLYDGIGYERANTDNSLGTNTTAVNSGAAVSGQEMPTIEPALFQRFILLMFEPGKFDDTKRNNFKKLRDMEEGGLSCITVELLKHRKYFEQNYPEHYDAVEKEVIKQTNNPNIDDRMMVNVAMILACYKTLEAKVTFPFTYEDVKNWMIENMKQQHLILAGSDDVRKWWEMVEFLFNSKNSNTRIVEGVDFELKEGKLFIRVQNVHPLYMNEMRQRNDTNALTKPTLENYLALDKNIYLDRIKHQFADGSYTWCMVFKYKPLGIDLIKVFQKKHQDGTAAESIEEFEARRREKMKEMGVDEPDLFNPKNESGQVEDKDLPF